MLISWERKNNLKVIRIQILDAKSAQNSNSIDRSSSTAKSFVKVYRGIAKFKQFELFRHRTFEKSGKYEFSLHKYLIEQSRYRKSMINDWLFTRWQKTKCRVLTFMRMILQISRYKICIQHYFNALVLFVSGECNILLICVWITWPWMSFTSLSFTLNVIQLIYQFL